MFCKAKNVRKKCTFCKAKNVRKKCTFCKAVIVHFFGEYAGKITHWPKARCKTFCTLCFAKYRNEKIVRFVRLNLYAKMLGTFGQ